MGKNEGLLRQNSDENMSETFENMGYELLRNFQSLCRGPVEFRAEQQTVARLGWVYRPHC